jgi:hypothetical protein
MSCSAPAIALYGGILISRRTISVNRSRESEACKHAAALGSPHIWDSYAGQYPSTSLLYALLVILPFEPSAPKFEDITMFEIAMIHSGVAAFAAAQLYILCDQL